jgi:hypothetical protein
MQLPWFVVREAVAIRYVASGDKKGLDKKWHRVENHPAPFLPSPCSELPPLLIAEIVCEESVWPKKPWK